MLLPLPNVNLNYQDPKLTCIYCTVLKSEDFLIKVWETSQGKFVKTLQVIYHHFGGHSKIYAIFYAPMRKFNSLSNWPC